jgi:hypothetical protein
MIDPQKDVIGGSHKASKFIMLETQVPHVCADALSHQRENLLAGSGVHINAIRRGNQNVGGNARIFAEK